MLSELGPFHPGINTTNSNKSILQVLMLEDNDVLDITWGECRIPYYTQNAKQGEMDGDVGGDGQVHDRTDGPQLKYWPESLQQGGGVWPRAV